MSEEPKISAQAAKLLAEFSGSVQELERFEHTGTHIHIKDAEIDLAKARADLEAYIAGLETKAR